MAQSRDRMVILTIDTLANLLVDYLGKSNLPEGATPVSLQINPRENGKLALLVEHPLIQHGAGDILADFDLKRVYTV